MQKGCGGTRQFFSSSSLFFGTSRTVGGPFFFPSTQWRSTPCSAAISYDVSHCPCARITEVLALAAMCCEGMGGVEKGV